MAYYDPRKNMQYRDPSADDYAKAAQGRPEYLQGIADLGAEDVADKARYGGDISRALIDFGVVPSNWSDAWGVVNPQVRGAAQANTEAGLSTFSRIMKQHRDSIRSLKRKLAARGMLRSGDLTHGLSEEDLLHRQNLSDAQRRLLEYFSGIQAAYAQAAQGRSQQQRSLLQNSYQNLVSSGGLAPIAVAPRGGASVVPGTTDWYSVLPSGMARAMEQLGL